MLTRATRRPLNSDCDNDSPVIIMMGYDEYDYDNDDVAHKD